MLEQLIIAAAVTPICILVAVLIARWLVRDL